MSKSKYATQRKREERIARDYHLPLAHVEKIITLTADRYASDADRWAFANPLVPNTDIELPHPGALAILDTLRQIGREVQALQTQAADGGRLIRSVIDTMRTGGEATIAVADDEALIRNAGFIFGSGKQLHAETEPAAIERRERQTAEREAKRLAKETAKTEAAKLAAQQDDRLPAHPIDPADEALRERARANQARFGTTPTKP